MPKATDSALGRIEEKIKNNLDMWFDCKKIECQKICNLNKRHQVNENVVYSNAHGMREARETRNLNENHTKSTGY